MDAPPRLTSPLDRASGICEGATVHAADRSAAIVQLYTSVCTTYKRTCQTSQNRKMLTRKQVKMARAALGWSVRDLGERAGVTANTISRYENGSDALTETLLKIRRVFEGAGIIFIPENGGGAGVRLKDRESDEHAN